MSSRRRLIAALDGFVRRRTTGVRTKGHLQPLLAFLAAELRQRLSPAAQIEFEVPVTGLFSRQVDCVVRVASEVRLTIIVLTQTGSIRKNLNNRRRDILGDAVNLRAANPDAASGVLYLLTSDDEARRKSANGTSPIDELGFFLTSMQRCASQTDRSHYDAAALIPVRQDKDGRIVIEPVPQEVDILNAFFETLVAKVPV
jgi:hypothetical protein